MKPISYFILFVSIFCFPISTKANIKFGVKAGLVFGKETNPPSLLENGSPFDISTKHATEVGVLMEGSLPVYQLYYDAGISFSRTGSEYKTSITGEDVLITETGYNRVNYFQIPIGLRYKVPIGNLPLKIYGRVGGYAGLAVSGSISSKQIEKGTGYNIIYNRNQKIKFGSDENNLFKRYDCGLSIGGGLEMVENLHVDFTYNIGLVDINNKDYQGIFVNNGSIKNRFWTLSLSYFF